MPVGPVEPAAWSQPPSALHPSAPSRSTARAGPSVARPDTGDESAGPAPTKAPRRRRPARDQAAERDGMRDIVGAGPSQLGVSGALRGRDVNRPSAADLADAERDVVIVRRNWRPT